jgi:hypothetical protein
MTNFENLSTLKIIELFKNVSHKIGQLKNWSTLILANFEKGSALQIGQLQNLQAKNGQLKNLLNL